METGSRVVDDARRWTWTLEASLKDPDIEEVIDRLLHRPLAFLLIRPLEHYATWITPTHVSLLSLVAGVAAGGVWFTGAGEGPGPLVLGALLLFVSVVLDCADGQLARLRGGGTHFGMMLDATVDFAVGISTSVGLGAAALHHAEAWWGWPASVAIVISTFIHLGLYDQFRETFERRLRGEPNTASVRAKDETPLERAAASMRELLYERLFRRIQGSSEEVALDSESFRRLFRRPMRLFALGGLGTHLFVFYGMALIFAVAPSLVLSVGCLIVVGVQNVLVVMAVNAWVRAEREARELAEH